MIKKRHNEQDMCGTGALVHQQYTVHQGNCRSFSKGQSQVKQLPLTLWWWRRQCFTFWPLSCNLDTWPRCYNLTAHKNCRRNTNGLPQKNAHTNTPVWCLCIFWCLGCLCLTLDPAYCFQCFSQAILKFLRHCHQFLQFGQWQPEQYAHHLRS